MLNDLQDSLRARLGEEITPEVAARLYAAAAYLPDGTDELLAPGVIEAGQRHWFDAASRQLGATYSPVSGHRLLVALDGAGHARAFAVFTRVQPGVRAELSAWVRGDHAGAGRSFVAEIFRFAFGRLHAKVVLALVAEDNVRSRRAARKLGFRREGRIPCWFGEHDALVLAMEPKHCKYWSTEGK